MRARGRGVAGRLLAPALALLLAFALVSPAATPPVPAVPPPVAPPVGGPPAVLAPLRAPARVAVRGGGIEVGERPFFPVGFYYVSWDESPEQLLATLRTIAAAGFNTIHAGWTATNGYEDFLDEAARLGVRVITEGAEPPTIAALRDKPAVLAWNIGDDVHENTTPEALGARAAAVRAADPDHPTYFTVFRAARWGPYLDKGDLVAPYSYPIPDSALGAVDRALDQARRSGQPLIGIPQAFAWEGKRPPTPAEARNMAYQYVVNGVRGLIMYNYNERGQLPLEYPELWAAYCALVPELAALAPALTGGAYTKLDTGVQGVLAAQWLHDGTLYLVVLNTDERAARRVDLPLPPGAGGAATPLFADRPAGLAVAGGRLRGTIAPRDVHVYTVAITARPPSPARPVPPLAGAAGEAAPPPRAARRPRRAAGTPFERARATARGVYGALCRAVQSTRANQPRVLTPSHAANPPPSG